MWYCTLICQIFLGTQWSFMAPSSAVFPFFLVILCTSRPCNVMTVFKMPVYFVRTTFTNKCECLKMCTIILILKQYRFSPLIWVRLFKTTVNTLAFWHAVWNKFYLSTTHPLHYCHKLSISGLMCYEMQERRQLASMDLNNVYFISIY